jgi:PiT family inorganic phosphate transporter
MEIKTIDAIEKHALRKSQHEFARIGCALFFLVGVLAYSFIVSGALPNSAFLAVAAVIAGYMAMNIGANDVANNVGPAVGAKALTMGGALFIAIVFEAAGAFIAGGDVVSTIKNGIIHIDAFGTDTTSFIRAMMSALLAAALWLNLATFAKAPVSTTHSIVGGVMGAGIAAAGLGIVDWAMMLQISLSWLVSPLVGGVIAALVLLSIMKTIINQKNKIKASYHWVPIYLAIMSLAFVSYLVLKGLKLVWPSLLGQLNQFTGLNMTITLEPTFAFAFSTGLGIALIIYFSVKYRIKSNYDQLNNDSASVNVLFTVPLIFAAALLSFAHGANDVANAIGPLAAINEAVLSGGIAATAVVPSWVMAIGAFGLAIGLALYGPRLIRTVGSEITELDQVRAFSVAMAAALTVIIASQLGLPVSSTHITIGAIFGVGFLREWLEHSGDFADDIQQQKAKLSEHNRIFKALRSELDSLEKKPNKSEQQYSRITDLYRLMDERNGCVVSIKTWLKNNEKSVYVKRNAVRTIVTAWVITLPASAVMSASIYYIITAALV